MYEQIEQEVDEEVFFKNTNMNNISDTITEQSYGDSTISVTYSNIEKLLDNCENQVSVNSSNCDPSPKQTQSQSLFSEQSTPVKRATDIMTEDRFNGILYHVIHSDGQITILFSSRDLYNKFIDAMNMELHAKKMNNARSNYTTHVKGKGCTLISDNNAASISASGPGSKLWREVIFSRHAIHLYQLFKEETDNVLNTQTSTPVTVVEKDQSSPPVSPVTRSGSASLQHKIVQQKLSLSELTSQVGQLHKISILLQEQLNLVNTKIDTLIKKSDSLSNAPPEIHNLSTSTISDDSNFLTLSETNGDDPKLIPGGASYCEIVTNRPKEQNSKLIKDTNLEPKQTAHTKKKQQTDRENKQNDKHEKYIKNKQFDIRDHNARTLIIGDSIISGINKKGLMSRVECQPVPGATIDSIIDKLQILDLIKFDNLVVYVGRNDSSGQSDIEHFEHKYQQLILLVKEKNSRCNIFLCSSCPRGDTDVNEFNEAIKRLCSVNKLIYVNSNADFYDKKGKLRYHFFKPRDNIHLSRSGTKRLLGTINNQLYIVENFEKCVFSYRQTYGNKKPAPEQHSSRYSGELYHRVPT